MKKYIFILTLALGWLPRANSQVTFTASDESVCENSAIDVEITVENFTSVTSLSFPVHWDVNVMAYTGNTISLPAVAGLNDLNAATGEVRFTWFDPSPPPPPPGVPGLTLGNGTVVLTLHFQAVGTYTSNMNTDVELLGPNFPSQVFTEGNLTPAPSSFEEGSVTIEDNLVPVIMGCPANISTTVPNGGAPTSVTWTSPTAMDNCALMTFDSTHASGDMFPEGTTTVTYSATDEAGNVAVPCSFTVTVIEMPDPNAVSFVASDVSLSCDEDMFSVTVNVFNYDDPTAMQFGLAWDPAILDYQGTTLPLGFPSTASFNDGFQASGELRYTWFDAAPPLGDEVFAQGELLMTVDFKLLDLSIDSTMVEFAAFPSPPFAIKVSDTGGQIPNTDIVFDHATIRNYPDTMPVFNNCPMDMNLTTEAGMCDRTVNYTLPTVTDDCDTPAPPLVQTSALGEGSSFPLGTSTVTYTATDSKGNVGTCSFTITITDDEDPVAICPAVIPDVALDASGNGTLPANIGDGSSTDNCPGVMETSPTATFTCADLGAQTVTLTATDGNGNTSTATCTFNVVDNISPAANCPASIADVMLDASGNGTLPANIGDGSSTDNCPGVTETSPTATFTCTDLGAQTVTLMATDGSGNTSTTNCTFNVVDNISPAANCPASIADVMLDASGNGTLPANIGDGSSTDNCSVTETSPTATFTCADLGPQTVTLTATDGSGNTFTATCSFNVVDNLEPAITCPADIAVNNNAGTCTATVTWPMPTATDNCDAAPTITCIPPSGTLFPAGDSTVICIAEDASGNRDTCMFTVTVHDIEVPDITCPADILMDNDPGECTAVVTWPMATATDNCGPPTITCEPPSGSTFPVGDTTVICIAEDMAGNRDTCTFKISVMDTELPTLTCPGDISIGVPVGTVDTMVNNVSLLSSGDNCGLDTTYFVLTGALTGDGPDDAAGTAFPIGTTNVKYYVVDEAGNIDSCDFDVTVVEGMVNVLSISCPPFITQANNMDECFASVSGTAITVNSGVPTDTSYVFAGATSGSGMGNVPEPTDFTVGETTVTYTVWNATDTVSCSFDITVQDTAAPVLNCPGSLTLGNNAGTCGLLFSNGFIPAVVTDNCGDVTVTSSPFSIGDMVPVGSHAITTIAVDTSGNADTCVYQLTINDVESPAWTDCPANIMGVPNAPGDCGAVVTWPEPTASDNCAVIAVTQPTHPAGSVFPAGEMTLVEYVAVDAAGNSAKCSFTVQVVDVEPPSIMPCPGNIVEVNDPGDCSAIVTWTLPLPDDNCGVVSFVSSGIPPGNVFPVGGPYQIGYSATDETGNTTVCTFEVRVNDTEFPQINNMPTDLTVPASPGQCVAPVNWTSPTAFDNCGIQSFDGSNDPGQFFSVNPPGTPHVVNYTATDINGNVTVEVFFINVVDDQVPEFDNCPTGNVIVNVDGTTTSPLITGFGTVDCENIQLNLANMTGTDNCGPVSVAQTFGPASGDIFSLGINTLTFQATDVNGNQSTCSFNIIVEGVPVAGAQALPDNPCEGDDVEFFVSNEVPGASYVWKDPSGAVVSNQSSFTLPSVALSQSGNFTVEVTLDFCQQEDAVAVEVFELPVIEIDYNDVLCSDGTVPLVLNGVNLGGATIAQWMWTQPNNNMAFGQTLTINDPSGTDAGFYTLQATSDNGCVGTVQTTDEVIVSSEPPMPDLFATPTAICLGESMVLNGEPFAGANVEYQWSADPLAGSGLPSPVPSNPVIEVSPTTPGTYTYFYQVISDGCASQMAEVAVQVEGAPVIGINVNGATACLTGDTDITLGVNQTSGSPIVGYFWTPGNTTNSNRVIANATSDSAGVYNVIVSTALGCTGTASVDLNDLTDALVTPTITPDNDSLCLGTNTTINVFPSYPSGTTYTWIVNGTMQPTSLPQLIVTPMNVGTTDISLMVSLDGCESDFGNTQIVTQSMGPVNVTVDGATDCLDGTSTVKLVAAADGATSFEWLNVGVFDACLPIENATVEDGGPYSVVATNGVGCVSQATYVLDLTPALQQVTAQQVSPACDMGDLELCAEPTIPGATYEWTGPGGNVIAMTQCPTLTNVSSIFSGSYQVSATLNGCKSVSEPLAVNVLAAPTANNEVVVGLVDQAQSFDVIANDEINGDFTISVMQQPDFGTVVSNGNGVFTYTPNKGFRETDRMAYEICYTDCPDACDIGIVTLLIRFPGDDCIATTVITPNDDGINDEFVVSCLEVDDYPQNTLHIFNQWGDQVYEAAPYVNNWRGTHNGKDLPDGTYFFIFTREPGAPSQKGFVMIHR